MDSASFQLGQIKPALMAYLREARLLLDSEGLPDTRTVHDVRVLMKKARSAIKLAEPQLINEDIKKDSVALREVGRVMRYWRETTILRKNMKEMKKEYPALFVKLSDNEKISAILRKPELMNEPDEKPMADLRLIRELLRKASVRIRFWKMSAIDHAMVLSEIEKSNASVRKIYLICRFKPSDKKLHRFRKKLKDLLYQLSFARMLSPKEIKALEKQFDALTGYLGKYNDLSLLAKSLDYSLTTGINSPAMDELIAKIRERQDRLLVKIWPLAMKLFLQPLSFYAIRNQ